MQRSSNTEWKNIIMSSGGGGGIADNDAVFSCKSCPQNTKRSSTVTSLTILYYIITRSLCLASILYIICTRGRIMRELRISRIIILPLPYQHDNSLTLFAAIGRKENPSPGQNCKNGVKDPCEDQLL